MSHLAGDTRDKAHQNKESMGKKEAEKQKLADNGKSRSDNITELQRQLEGAKKRVSEASAKVKELEGVLPVVGGLSPEEEQLLAEKAIPLEEKSEYFFRNTRSLTVDLGVDLLTT